jgi:sugar-specific transcriptional regulator TrmB
MIEDILKEIGLTDSEVKVYLALLELGDSTRTNIVKSSKIAGSKVYDILEKLQQKGLVAIYIKDNVKHFKAVNPRQISNYLEKKRDEIIILEKQASDILPMLLAKFNSSKVAQEVELLTGMKGLEVIFREQVEMLKKGETCYVIGGTKGFEEASVVAFFQKIHDMREQKGILTKMLYNTRQKKDTKENYSKKKYPHTITKYIQHTSPVAINIYKNRTAIIVFGKEIITIHMKSADIANSFLEYFNILWKQSKS